jgi:hypothetical protein
MSATDDRSITSDCTKEVLAARWAVLAFFLRGHAAVLSDSDWDGDVGDVERSDVVRLGIGRDERDDEQNE